jgi:hypothetical protein
VGVGGESHSTSIKNNSWDICQKEELLFGTETHRNVQENKKVKKYQKTNLTKIQNGI